MKVLHFCLPNDDNLGDQLAHMALPLCFSNYGVTLEIDQVDIRQLRNTSTHLDNKIDFYKYNYDLIVIGAGGLLLPFFIESIFSDPDTWSKLKVPLIFFGVGAIGEYARPSRFTSTSRNDSQHLVQALNAASVISVRDLRSLLLVSRLVNGPKKTLFLTGCPTVFCTSSNKNATITHDLALNIPFTHGGCFQHQKQLLQIANLMVHNVKKLKWICHSNIEYDQITRIRDSNNLAFDITLPSTPAEIGDEYSSCNAGLVTKAHSGIFCLANNIPFAFLSYDMKCDALMEMIVDHPHKYLVHIDEITETNLTTKLKSVLDKINADGEMIKKAQLLLIDHFKKEFDAFVDYTLHASQHSVS